MIKKGFFKLLLLVGVLILFFQSGNILRAFFPLAYEEVITNYAQEYGVDEHLVMAVIKAESNFETDAVSHKTAKGLMQLMPDTANWIAGKLGLGSLSEEALLTPEMNIGLGCYYLSYLEELYDGDLTCVLAAYNAGHGNVDRWLLDPAYSADQKTLTKIPYAETEQYVAKVKNYLRIYRMLYPTEEEKTE